ncbi:hypothetical protein Hanom_Chr10g00904691 [Helianthus anomalus]
MGEVSAGEMRRHRIGGFKSGECEEKESEDKNESTDGDCGLSFSDDVGGV